MLLNPTGPRPSVLSQPQTTRTLLGGVPRYGNLLSENRPDELDTMAGGGYDAPTSYSEPRAMNTQQEHGLASVGPMDVSMRDVAFGLMEQAGPFGKMQSMASQAALGGLQAAFGPHGVVGGPVAPQPGTQAFNDVVSAGQRASAMNNKDLSPMAAFGLEGAPVHGGFMAHDQTANNAMSSLGNAIGGLLGFGDQAPSPADALGEVASGRAGRGGNGNDGGNAGADSGYGGPDGVGRGNARGGGIGF